MTRFVRHRPMIGWSEAATWSDLCVAVAGMGVGSGVALGCALVGTGTLRIADGDRIDEGNLNRHLIATRADLHKRKTQVVGRHVAEIDSTIDVQEYGNVCCEDDAERFVSGASVVIEEVDSMQAKWDLRLAARRHRIPVITATDLWDRVVVDIEDYAGDPQCQPFHGLISPSLPDLEAQLHLFGRYCAPAFTQAVMERESGFPQFAPTGMVAAGLVVTVVQDLVVNRTGRYATGRYVIDLRNALESK